MKTNISFLLVAALTLLNFSLTGQNYNKPPMPGAEKIRPDKVRKELKIKALDQEISNAQKNLEELNAMLNNTEKGSDENIILELRRMLKEDYLNGIKHLQNKENDKINAAPKNRPSRPPRTRARRINGN